MSVNDDTSRLHFISTSGASDGSFVAISEIGALLSGEPHRLIGGVAVVLHQYRLGIDHPIRATADADFGVPPFALQDDSLVGAVASLGYERSSGNRWVRALSGERRATVDLLVPSFRSRLRASVQVGSTNSPEDGGLAAALRRPAVPVSADATLTDGTVVSLDVALPDLASLLGLKLHARRVRSVDRDAVDLWTCLELLAAAGQTSTFGDHDFDAVRGQLSIEFADDGPSMSVAAAGVDDDEAARRRTRLRGLVRAVSSAT
ncbi:MAG: hypothetical protein QNM02_10265 [Acidimicrobiia bacterium]|nr:hypothetical protein [Acidimicrobiia bacterium]